MVQPAIEGKQSRISRAWCIGCFLAGFIVSTIIWILIYDPTLLGLRGTVPHPRPVPEPLPGTVVVAPLCRTWDFDSEDIPWQPVLPLAQISDSVYKQGSELDAILGKWGLDTMQEFTSGSMYACVASNDEVVVIAFRGTNADELADWLADATILRDPVPDGQIHRGFYRSTKSMLAPIVTAVEEQGGKRKLVWLTGHSLGGAMALVFAYECILKGETKPVGLVTFGQPLVVDSKLANFLNQELKGKYLRFVHSGDLIPRVFPTFSHCGSLVWFVNGRYEFRRPQTPKFAADPPATADAEALEYGVEVEPMTRDEFKSFQSKLKSRERRPRLRERRRDLKAGAPAFLEDHFMAGYMHWIVEFSAKAKPIQNGATK